MSIQAVWADAKQLKVQLHILKGFHINGQQAEKDLVPTQLTVDPADNVKAIEYPPEEKLTAPFADKPITVYSGEPSIIVNFKDEATSKSKLTVSLRYQACDDSACLTPVRKSIVVAPR